MDIEQQMVGSWLKPNLLRVSYCGGEASYRRWHIPSWEYYLQCQAVYCQKVQQRVMELGGQTVYLMHTPRQVRLPRGNPTQYLLQAYRLVPDHCIWYVVTREAFLCFALGYMLECLRTPRLKIAKSMASVLKLAAQAEMEV